MTYCLFLDDERNLSDVTWAAVPSKINNDWKTVRNFEEFTICIASYGLPKFVAFDHDLADEHYVAMLKEVEANNDKKFIFWSEDDMGGMNITVNYGSEKTGYDCAKWLVDYCADNGYKFPDYVVHSMNPIGKQRINSYIENAKKHLAV